MAVSPRTVAIACQGGGSHTAFTAGVLRRFLQEKTTWDTHGYRIGALSGTSGGAICALLAWYGLVQDDWPGGIKRLEAFWSNNTAREPWDVMVNQWVQALASWRDFVALPELSPYAYPPWAEERLRAMLEAEVDFATIPALVRPEGPALLVAAVSVLSGKFKVFRNERVTLDAVIASAAIPNIFRATCIRNLPYWDGLFSQNPPVRDLVDDVEPPSAKPDEIWVIQINPLKRRSEPRRVGEILDRRNEMGGNLSLQQELYHIRKMNQLIRTGIIQSPKYKLVRVRVVALDEDLPLESKLDRSPAFIERMMRHGDEAAGAFLATVVRRAARPARTKRLR
jgi:NTE family protein